MLGYVLIAGALAAGLVSGSGIAGTAAYFIEGALSRGTIELIAVVTLIEMLTVLLESTGSLQRMLTSLRGVIRDARILMALVPSVLGLFPVPGGAILSAPIVGKYGDELAMDADAKSGINLYFRHIWDQVFPFKPHLILAAAVLNVPLFTLIGWQLPATIVAALLGFWFLIAREHQAAPPNEVEMALPVVRRPMALEVAPLVLPLLLALGAGMGFAYAMAAGLLLGVIIQGASPPLLRKMISRGVRFRLLFILVAVMVFKTVVEHAGIVGGLAALLTSLGIPPWFLVALLPLAVGAATGLEVAVVALAYPLLMGLLPEGSPAMPFILVMMVFNAVGSTLSPAHLCMAAGNEYYGASLARVIQINAVPQALRVLATVLFAWGIWAVGLV